MQYLASILNFLKQPSKLLKSLEPKSSYYRPSLRIVEITKGKSNNYMVRVQLIHKSTILEMMPEEILTDDDLTNQFSPTDVRTLTYLGYQDLNSPKYSILAKRLSDENEQMLFAIQKKGEKRKFVKTANEISSDENMLSNLTQKDAHMIGFTTATEQLIIENRQKQSLVKQLNDEVQIANKNPENGKYNR